MEIRIATVTDLPAIVKIHNQAIRARNKTGNLDEFTVGQRKKWFETHLNQKYTILVALENNVVVGYASISPYREGRTAFLNTAELSYYVDFGHHKKGIGTQLVKESFQYAINNGIKVLVCILLSVNKVSIKLLEKNGFSLWGTMPNAAEIDSQKMDHLYFGREINQ
ncbi:GNAT family N-acetyltransferase [Aureibaculum conchae]|uniref:GNAT family N-acetyltransferase n=1 Tax=Aureibaculum sp. 2308TA14-22 TaxID=3108392 RepID=UPI00339859C9